MWKCPKCNRDFNKTNQSHTCSAIPKTVDEYINLQPENIQLILEQIRNAIKKEIPDIKEKISWSMPTFYKEKIIIQYASFKEHIGVFPGPDAIENFANQLVSYKTSKGTIQIKYNQKLPIDLIVQISRWCFDTRNK